MADTLRVLTSVVERETTQIEVWGVSPDGAATGADLGGSSNIQTRTLKTEDKNLNKHYVKMIVSDLRQVGGFVWILRFPLPVERTVMV